MTGTGIGTAAVLHGPAYVLGEIEVRLDEIPSLEARAEELRMAPDPALWGWGRVFRTERGLAAMAVDSAAATMRAAGAPAGSVEALVLCCSDLPGPAEAHGRFVGAVLDGAGLGPVPFYGVNYNRCVNVLAGIDVAAAFVHSGRYRRVLVVTTDRVADEADRVTSYALFSDGAASCLVAAEGELPGGWRVEACASAQDPASLGPEREISSDLARAVNDRLLSGLGMKPGDLDALLHGNIYKPLLVTKERQAGFSTAQLSPDAVARVGHCFSADPLINLVDRAALGHLRSGGYCMLAASVPGSRVGVLLRTLSG